MKNIKVINRGIFGSDGAMKFWGDNTKFDFFNIFVKLHKRFDIFEITLIWKNNLDYSYSNFCFRI